MKTRKVALLNTILNSDRVNMVAIKVPRWSSDHNLFHMDIAYQPISLQFSDALESEDHFFSITKPFHRLMRKKRFKANLNGIFSWSAMTV